MTHQGPEWLDESSNGAYAEINPAGRFGIHFFGHMHEEVIRGESVGGGQLVRKWQGPSLFGLEKYGEGGKHDRRHGYAAGSLRSQGGHFELRHWPRKAVFNHVNGWRFIRDDENCILQDDGGTRPDTIETTERQRMAPKADSQPASFFESFRQHCIEAWDADFSNAYERDPARPPYIETQPLELLGEVSDPREFLHADYFRMEQPAQDADLLPDPETHGVIEVGVSDQWNSLPRGLALEMIVYGQQLAPHLHSINDAGRRVQRASTLMKAQRKSQSNAAYDKQGFEEDAAAADEQRAELMEKAKEAGKRALAACRQHEVDAQQKHENDKQELEKNAAAAAEKRAELMEKAKEAGIRDLAAGRQYEVYAQQKYEAECRLSETKSSLMAFCQERHINVDAEEIIARGSLGRAVLTHDAGQGKSAFLRWIQKEICRSYPERLAVLVDVANLCQPKEDTLRYLASTLNCSIALLRSLLESGNVVFLLDSMDQVPSDASFQCLNEFCKDIGATSTFLIASRPQAIGKYWNTLFAHPGTGGKTSWRFLKLGYFNTKLQIDYLVGQRHFE